MPLQVTLAASDVVQQIKLVYGPSYVCGSRYFTPSGPSQPPKSEVEAARCHGGYVYLRQGGHVRSGERLPRARLFWVQMVYPGGSTCAAGFNAALVVQSAQL